MHVVVLRLPTVPINARWPQAMFTHVRERGCRVSRYRSRTYGLYIGMWGGDSIPLLSCFPVSLPALDDLGIQRVVSQF